MKKNVLMIGLLALSLGFAACSDDNKDNNGGTGKNIPEGTEDVEIQDNNIDVTSQNMT